MIRTLVTLLSWFIIVGLLLGQAAVIAWWALGLPLTGSGIIATFIGAGLLGVAIAICRGEPSKAEQEPRMGPLPGWTVGPLIFMAGVVPFTLLDGWGDYGNASIWPWLAGFGAQAVAVAALVLWVRRRTR